MSPERFTSAYRLGLGIALIYILWMLLPAAMDFSRLVVKTASRSPNETATPRPQRVNAPGPKLTAASLESALLETKKFGPAPQLRCVRAGRPWDYACSYMPTPAQSSTTRLQFGVNVDAERWVRVSGIVPMSTALPPPQ